MIRRLLPLVLRHPGLLPDLLRSGWTVRRLNWFRRPPFLPLPSTAYLEWRMETAYGDAATVPPVEELRRYLRWAREIRRAARAER